MLCLPTAIKLHFIGANLCAHSIPCTHVHTYIYGSLHTYERTNAPINIASLQRQILRCYLGRKANSIQMLL